MRRRYDDVVLRVNIEGDWRVLEMSEALKKLNDLHDILLYVRADTWSAAREALEFAEEPLCLENPQAASRVLRLLERRDVESDTGDFATRALDQMAQLRTYLLPDSLRRVMAEYAAPFRPLELREIRYGSPGHIDVVGVGEVTGNVKELLLGLITLYLERKKRAEIVNQLKLANKEQKLKLKQLEVEVEMKKLELLHMYVEIMKEAGFSKTHIKQVIHKIDLDAENLGKLIEAGKITSVMIVSDQGSA